MRNFCLGEKCNEVYAYFVIGEKAECAKTWPRLAAAIEVRPAAGEMNAKGDDCSGPPKFVSNLKLHPI